MQVFYRTQALFYLLYTVFTLDLLKASLIFAGKVGGANPSLALPALTRKFKTNLKKLEWNP
jgi:hypothetical protein